MVPPINPSLSVSQNTPQRDTIVNKDDFLRLLVAQLEHQDPLKPQDDTAFVTQLAQFAQLEQSQQHTALLAGMQAVLAGQTGTQATSLIGHRVTANLGAVSLRKGQAAQPLHFALDADATSVKLIVRDHSGAAVRTLQSGAAKAGTQELSWDGKDDAGQALPDGTYRYEVQATAADGKPAAVRMEVSGVVASIAYDHDLPELVLQDGTRVRFADVVSVGK